MHYNGCEGGSLMKVGLRLSGAVALSIVFVLASTRLVHAGGAREESEGSRGAYVAEQGKIIPPGEISISSYVASVDYGYPDPPGEFGLTLYSGHRQVSLAGQEEIIQIGIQGGRTPFESLPVLNLAFVFDSSGSMSEKDKIVWAKESLALLLRRLRPQDILAVVAFAGEGRVLLPATRVGEIGDRKALVDRVEAVIAEGPSRLDAGLHAGYEQVRAGFRPDWVNRVVLVSDGLADPARALEIVEAFRRQAITLSAVAVGMNCDLKTMNALSKRGAGSSRFLSSREKMEEVFGADLDRMIVPIAYDLSIRLKLGDGVELLDTWGYDHEVEGRRVRYALPALHHRDYETILCQVRLPPRSVPGRETVARVELEYEDRTGSRRTLGPFALSVEYADSTIAAGGISDPTVLKAGTMLHTAQGLETIGHLYYSDREHAKTLARLNQSGWTNTEVSLEERLAAVLASQRAETQESIRANLHHCLDVSEALKKEIQNTRLRLGEECFTQELTIVTKYIEILAREIGLPPGVTARLLADQEMSVEMTAGGQRKQLEDLVRELTAVLELQSGASVAFFGFTMAGGEATALQRSVDQIARSRLQKMPRIRLVEQAAVERELARLEIRPPSLLDNEVAFRAGAALGAEYLLVGRIVDMPASRVVFGKLLNRRSGAVESVAQTILAVEQ